MTDPSTSTHPIQRPAIVLGAGLNGLGVARSLARAGVPVWLADSDPHRAEMYTRAARPLPIAALQGDGLIAELIRLGTTRFADQRPVLFLTQEETVRTISEQRSQLANLYRLRLPSIETVEALQHKSGFQHLAEKFGAPIPPLVRVQSEADLPALANLNYPVVVKPGERNAEYSHRFKKAYRIESAGEALALVRTILPVMADVVVQEWTEGPDSSIYFCLQYLDADGNVAANFTGRKVRSWPPQVGGTASCMPAPAADAELAALTAKFFHDAGVTGMAGMEYKRDSRSGQFRMVEPTIGRTDYQAEVATLNGVNLPHAAYCCETGTPFPAPEPTPHARAWRVRSEDVQSARAQHQSADEGFDDVHCVTDALWRWNDPRPAMVASLHHATRALRTRANRWMPLKQPAGSKP